MDRRAISLLLSLAMGTVAYAAEPERFAELPRLVLVPEPKPYESATIPQKLPESAIPPGTRPERAADVPIPSDAPAPEPRPKDGSPTGEGNGAAPVQGPAAPGQTARPDEKTGEPTEPEPQYDADPRSAQRALPSIPAEEIACRTRLGELGVIFEARPEEHDEAGCALPYPLFVRSFGKVTLEPAALMNCAMAEASARFARDVIQPAAQRSFGEDLVSIAQASGYVCRPRHGTRKLSEHAFGNALDIASLALSKGTLIEVKAGGDEKHVDFLDDLRKAACGPFKTVLGPGSDADHATHLHVDLAPRRNGGTYCK